MNDVNPKPTTPPPKVLGILVTYRRPTELATMLDCLDSQTRQLDRLVVVDNYPGPDSQEVIVQHQDGYPRIEYLPMEENIGPAGGIGRGMAHTLAEAQDRDWLLLLDDDDPPWSETIVERLLSFGLQMLEKDPMTALVGQGGGRFDRRRGQLVRVKDSELEWAVPLDHITGNQFPLYLCSALRKAGVFHEELFFGFEELEFGLRLRNAGYSIYALGSLWKEARARKSHRRPSRVALGVPTWRRYYSLRNLIYLLRKNGHSLTALRITVIRGIAKPLASLPMKPHLSLQHLRLNLRAARDGWTGRLGRQLPPDGYSEPHGTSSSSLRPNALVDDVPPEAEGAS